MMRAPPSLFRTISHFSHTHIRARRGQGHAVRHCAPPALAPARAQHAPCTLVNGGGGKKREQDERERARARERYERAILRRASLFSLFQGRSCIPTAPPPLALEERERMRRGARARAPRSREYAVQRERQSDFVEREREREERVIFLLLAEKRVLAFVALACVPYRPRTPRQSSCCSRLDDDDDDPYHHHHHYCRLSPTAVSPQPPLSRAPTTHTHTHAQSCTRLRPLTALPSSASWRLLPQRPHTPNTHTHPNCHAPSLEPPFALRASPTTPICVF